ncbi:MAG: hypothetical protein K2Q33_07130 [Gammaproteobacteria bacterium]|nr:hypothetical protein [Gammaproteobacteria bacterium]
MDDIKEGAFCSGPMVGCHLVIGALNDKSFMAHNNEDPDCAWAKDQTIAMIKANPSGNYYLFFTSATLGIFSPKDYLKAMEESYGVIFEGAFYYDENESPRKSWVEVRYHPKSASLQVSGFTMTYPDMKSVRHDCPVVLLSKDTPSEHFNLPVQNRPNNRFSC